MKSLKFVTATELDPVTSQILNNRFVGYLDAFRERNQLDFARAYHCVASEILQDAQKDID